MRPTHGCILPPSFSSGEGGQHLGAHLPYLVCACRRRRRVVRWTFGTPYLWPYWSDRGAVSLDGCPCMRGVLPVSLGSTGSTPRQYQAQTGAIVCRCVPRCARMQLTPDCEARSGRLHLVSGSAFDAHDVGSLSPECRPQRVAVGKAHG